MAHKARRGACHQNQIPPECLTDREFQIAWMLAMGHSGQEIRQRLGIGLQTFKNHLTGANEATGTQGRLQLALWLIRVTGIYDDTGPAALRRQGDT